MCIRDRPKDDAPVGPLNVAERDGRYFVIDGAGADVIAETVVTEGYETSTEAWEAATNTPTAKSD